MTISTHDLRRQLGEAKALRETLALQIGAARMTGAGPSKMKQIRAQIAECDQDIAELADAIRAGEARDQVEEHDGRGAQAAAGRAATVAAGQRAIAAVAPAIAAAEQFMAAIETLRGAASDAEVAAGRTIGAFIDMDTRPAVRMRANLSTLALDIMNLLTDRIAVRLRHEHRMSQGRALPGAADMERCVQDLIGAFDEDVQRFVMREPLQPDEPNTTGYFATGQKNIASYEV